MINCVRGVSAGSHPHTAVASSSVSVVGMSAPPSASVSVMGSEQAAAVESAAGKAIRDKVKEDGGPIPKEVANVSFHPNLDDNVDVTAHVVSIKAGPYSSDPSRVDVTVANRIFHDVPVGDGLLGPTIDKEAATGRWNKGMPLGVAWPALDPKDLAGVDVSKFVNALVTTTGDASDASRER